MKIKVWVHGIGFGVLSLTVWAAPVAFAAALTPAVVVAPVVAPQVQAPIIRSQAQGEVMQASTPLRLVGHQEFCAKLAQSFGNIGVASGFDRVHTAMLASGAAVHVVEEFRSGRASDFIRAGLLRTIANVPAVASDQSYLPLSGIVGEAMGVGSNAALALSSGELRYIPAAQRGSDVVVIAQNAASLTPDRTRQVAEIARTQGIRVSIVWVGSGEESQGKHDARTLSWLAAVTGGGFADLGGQASPCGSSL